MSTRLLPVLLVALCLQAGAADYAPVLPGTTLRLPQDHAAHPNFRTEWWYVTGWLSTDTGEELGFQITFFRSRRAAADKNPSAFAARQILFAHAAIADPRRGRLLHAQRAARQGFGLAAAATDRLHVRIDDWNIQGEGKAFSSRIESDEIALDLYFRETQPALLQGAAGYSRKGPRPQDASHYVSLPQLQVQGRLRRDASTENVHGRAWFDHEWSSSYLTPGAVGWDWIGINLDDGGALMAFRIRDRAGLPLWSAATRRHANGQEERLAGTAVQFTPQRRWRSRRTGTEYPVGMQVKAGGETFQLAPLMDDQELDSRASTGTLYWEGAVRASRDGKPVGRGYLELTGYAEALRF